MWKEVVSWLMDAEQTVDMGKSGLLVDGRLKGWWVWKEMVSMLMEGRAASGYGRKPIC